MLDQVEAKISVEQLIKRANLTAREKHVIEQRYWGNQIRSEIGAELKLSSTRIMQIERKALRKLRRKAGIKLDDWLTPKPKPGPPYRPPPPHQHTAYNRAVDRVTIHCDDCGKSHSGNDLKFTASKEDIETVRQQVRKLGWTCVDGQDLCQSCAAISRGKPITSWPIHQAENHRSSA